jgi:hypothetical protein
MISATSFQSFFPGAPYQRLFKPFQKGERVKLIIRNYYRDEQFNPLWGGTQGHVVGTITYTGGDYRSKTGCFIDVIWDNGCRNTYRHVDIERVSPWEAHKDQHLEDELFDI